MTEWLLVVVRLSLRFSTIPRGLLLLLTLVAKYEGVELSRLRLGLLLLIMLRVMTTGTLAKLVDVDCHIGASKEVCLGWHPSLSSIHLLSWIRWSSSVLLALLPIAYWHLLHTILLLLLLVHLKTIR